MLVAVDGEEIFDGEVFERHDVDDDIIIVANTGSYSSSGDEYLPYYVRICNGCSLTSPLDDTFAVILLRRYIIWRE